MTSKERLDLYITLIKQHTEIPASAYECKNRLEKLLSRPIDLSDNDIKVGTQVLNWANCQGYPFI
jgi:hypothetical protein